MTGGSMNYAQKGNNPKAAGIVFLFRQGCFPSITLFYIYLGQIRNPEVHGIT